MNCANHAEVESSAFCTRCGKALCSSCVHLVRGSVYCEPCLAASVESSNPISQPPNPPPGPPPNSATNAAAIGGGSPGAAALLGLIPGVGAIYNAEYFKAAIHILIFGTLVTIADEAGVGAVLFGLLTFGFYVYMPFEAYYTAKKRKLAREGINLETPFDDLNEQLGRIKNKEMWGGITLIALGAIFLLDNFGILQIERLSRLWPVLLIAAGFFLLRRFQEKES